MSNAHPYPHLFCHYQIPHLLFVSKRQQCCFLKSLFHFMANLVNLKKPPTMETLIFLLFNRLNQEDVSIIVDIPLHTKQACFFHSCQISLVLRKPHQSPCQFFHRLFLTHTHNEFSCNIQMFRTLKLGKHFCKDSNQIQRYSFFLP